MKSIRCNATLPKPSSCTRSRMRRSSSAASGSRTTCALSARGPAGVVALVGLGGAGKTSLAARFLDELLETARQPRLDGLFVWSFYQQPDSALFLQQAHSYFAGAGPVAAAPPARGAALLHLLSEALSRGGPHLLILDGLERVQQQGRRRHRGKTGESRTHCSGDC